MQVRVFLIGLNEKDQTITAEAAYTSEKQGLMGILSSNAGYVALQYDSFIKVGLATYVRSPSRPHFCIADEGTDLVAES